MKPTVDAYTVALPWDERDDFHRLWELANARNEMPSDYDVWHKQADDADREDSALVLISRSGGRNINLSSYGPYPLRARLSERKR